MLQQQQAILSGESVGLFPRRKQMAPAMQRAQYVPPAQPVAQPVQQQAPPVVPVAKSIEREEIMRDYAASIPPVDMSDYFRGVLAEIKDESSIFDPMAADESRAETLAQAPVAVTPVVPGANKDVKLAQIIKILYAMLKRGRLVDLQIPIAHSAIDDRRLYFDSLNIASTFNGDINGEIRVNFANLTNMAPPEQVVKITVLPFMFPHIYGPNNRIFDIFYNKTVYMTLRSVPQTYLAQTKEADAAFTFELNVAQDDHNMMYLVPKEPTFILTQPVSFQSEICVRFQSRLPTGTFQSCSLPPSQLRVRRISADFPTMFEFVDNYYIGILAPPWATHQVPVLFRPVNPAVPTVLSNLIANDIGYVTSSYSIVAGRGRFTLVWNSTEVALGANEEIIMIIPKNSIGFSIRFSSLRPSKTNDLVPIHS